MRNINCHLYFVNNKYFEFNFLPTIYLIFCLLQSSVFIWANLFSSIWVTFKYLISISFNSCFLSSLWAPPQQFEQYSKKTNFTFSLAPSVLLWTHTFKLNDVCQHFTTLSFFFLFWLYGNLLANKLGMF